MDHIKYWYFLAILFYRFKATLRPMATNNKDLSTPAGWRQALDSLPARKAGDGPLPAFFFAHGHPAIAFKLPGRKGLQTVGGPLHNFLKDFGPALMKKYEPKAIVVFSGHWESPSDQILVTDYGQDQPLLYDYYGFPDELYQAKWHSNGSSQISDMVVETLNQAGISARKTNRLEPRGEDGVIGPAPGLDHGVFIPFMLMFPEGKEKPFRIPVIQVSVHGSLHPAQNIKLGQAVSSLRNRDILILSGGLTIHTFRDWTEWDYKTASSHVKEFESAIVQASLEQNPVKRLEKLADLKKLPGFKIAQPREDHFVPIWIAAGAGSDSGETRVISDIHGCKTIAFGVE